MECLVDEDAGSCGIVRKAVCPERWAQADARATATGERVERWSGPAVVVAPATCVHDASPAGVVNGVAKEPGHERETPGENLELFAGCHLPRGPDRSGQPVKESRSLRGWKPEMVDIGLEARQGCCGYAVPHFGGLPLEEHSQQLRHGLRLAINVCELGSGVRRSRC